MNTIGFCDSLNDLLKNSFDITFIDGAVNNTRVIGTIALIIMIVICAVGMEWEVKAQNVLVLIIIGAIVNFMIGTILGPNETKDIAEGFTGFSMEVFQANLKSDYRYSEGKTQDFFTVFAIFFPSVTGIQAGANISGDLKDPAKSIPKGTILALFISMMTYMIFVFFVGGAALRDGSGIVADVANSTFPYQFACMSNNVS
jgi:solute carrier family 12 (sodium/potassium/chloride transporter), member 2